MLSFRFAVFPLNSILKKEFYRKKLDTPFTLSAVPPLRCIYNDFHVYEGFEILYIVNSDVTETMVTSTRKSTILKG